MRKIIAFVTFLLLIGIVYWSFYALMPQNYSKINAPETSFSTERALQHVRAISVAPHYVGTKAHEEVKSYIIDELNKLGIDTEVQEGYTAGDWANLSKASNILGRIKGSSNNGKALLLLAHYDSSPHSSYGASDDGSGVATILESLRAFLATKKQPKNDIIILISDGEELGLNGAKLFVQQHQWAQDVGLVLNFEARGSGGPSYMLIETNQGNANLIKAFEKANPQYPVASSLMYSIYKKLPNDTDLTVFREDGDIQGFNFAFIDDHFDYHTALDTAPRLDKNTLEHQGSYLMPLLTYFANHDLSALRTHDNDVYFNIPLFHLISYPYGWIIPIFIITVFIFISLLIYGFSKRKINFLQVLLGFVPMLFSIAACGAIGFFAWPLILKLNPGFYDILQGFSYNGHYYIASVAALSLALCFLIYGIFNKVKVANLMVAPILLWLVINGFLLVYLDGASFFIIPVFFALLAFYVTMKWENPSFFLLLLLAIPSIWIFCPLIQMFPVGLGLKMLISSSLLVALVFSLIISLFGQYKGKVIYGLTALAVGLACFGIAQNNAAFNKEKPKPSSLVYLQNDDNNTAEWGTYDYELSSWNSQYFKNAQKDDGKKVFSSKYGNGFTITSQTISKEIPAPSVTVESDTIIGNNREVRLCITPQREVNRLDISTPSKISSCIVNNIPLSNHFLEKRQGKLVTHYISDNDFTEVQITFDAKEKPVLTLYESSNDLLTNSKFNVRPRPENEIPMGFVLNDAIIVKKTIHLD
ncbi:M20/M25/M40 family metallo-hydrolase [Zhouia sp. PK063]|uniref:M20/M25/M40 family metallo-hydrolase n=1 Tax=Zhouia sp. PK063 TaxID=3373602 RepID=UPI0037BDB1B9